MSPGRLKSTLSQCRKYALGTGLCLGDLGNTVFLKEYVLNKQALFLTAEFSLADAVSLKRILFYLFIYSFLACRILVPRPGMDLCFLQPEGAGTGTNSQTHSWDPGSLGDRA